MSGKILLYAVILSALLIQYGCIGELYSMRSQPWLDETSPFSPTETYGYYELPRGGWHDPMRVSGVEMEAYLFNQKTIHENISFIVPIPLKIPEGSGIGDMGRRPFTIVVDMRAEDDGATFDPTGTRLYMGTFTDSFRATEVLLGKKVPGDCLYDGNPPTSAVDKVNKPVPIPLKVSGATRAEEVTHAICLYFLFDVPTPDPSEKFHLKLGEIVTPSGKSIRPTIYFTPVNVVEIVH